MEASMHPIMLDDGIIIRDAKPGDAKAMNAYLGITYATAKHMITREDEFSGQTYARRMWISRKLLNPMEACLIAYREQTRGRIEVVGMLDSWADRRVRVGHSCGFTMSVHPKMQRRGIGNHLLNQFINWVRGHETLRRIDLHVHSDNVGAYLLYEKLGFIEEGRRKGAILYEDGRVVDDILMALWPAGDQPTSNADKISEITAPNASFQDTLASIKG